MNTREWFDNLYDKFKNTPEYMRECAIWDREEKVAMETAAKEIFLRGSDAKNSLFRF